CERATERGASAEQNPPPRQDRHRHRDPASHTWRAPGRHVPVRLLESGSGNRASISVAAPLQREFLEALGTGSPARKSALEAGGEANRDAYGVDSVESFVFARSGRWLRVGALN